MKPVRKAADLKELEKEWYAKLKKTKCKEYPNGFQDIEDHSEPDRPLKAWHSKKFGTERSLERQANQAKYNKQIEDFLNHYRINEICRQIAEHGNSTVTPKTVKKILELHSDGKPEREIAKKVRRGKKCVHLTLSKAREWMKVA